MSAYEFEVVDLREQETVLVRLAGELDLTNSQEIEERLTAGLQNGSRLVIDLSRVLFIDSAALHVLFRLSRTLAAPRMTVVVEPGAPVARTLEIVGVHDAMRVVASADDLT